MRSTEIMNVVIGPVLEDWERTRSLQPSGDRAPETPLLGAEGLVDSLDLVEFVIRLEGKVREATSRTVTLISDEALSRKVSPFLNLGELAEYISELLSPFASGSS